MRTYNWPTREEWARSRQHPYWDSDTGCPFADRIGHRLSDYATPQEVAALIAALKDLYRELGREMREMREATKQLPEAEQETSWAASWAPECCKSDRRQINELLGCIGRDEIPHRARGGLDGKPAELVAPFIKLYDAVREAAREQWEEECLQIPIDDAAWEEELQRRQEVEQKRADDDAHPERFIHRV
jgi:hypothetical protein